MIRLSENPSVAAGPSTLNVSRVRLGSLNDQGWPGDGGRPGAGLRWCATSALSRCATRCSDRRRSRAGRKSITATSETPDEQGRRQGDCRGIGRLDAKQRPLEQSPLELLHTLTRGTRCPAPFSMNSPAIGFVLPLGRRGMTLKTRAILGGDATSCICATSPTIEVGDSDSWFLS